MSETRATGPSPPRQQGLQNPAGPQDRLVQQQYLTFMLAGETYAMGILAIKEIIEYGNLTIVPRMPGFIRGVINLRGAVVPVIDLSARFGKQLTKVTRRTCIVIIEVAGEHGQQDMGVMVDAVNAVLDILPQDIEPAPSFGASIRADFISGMGKVDGNFVIILEMRQVLDINDLSALASGRQNSLAVISAGAITAGATLN